MRGVEAATCDCWSSDEGHKQRHLQAGALDACVDEGIYALLSYLARLGCSTIGSCEHFGENDGDPSGMATVSFRSAQDLERALMALSAEALNAGRGDIFVRATGQGSGQRDYGPVGVDGAATQHFFELSPWTVKAQTSWWVRFSLAVPRELSDPRPMMYALSLPIEDAQALNELLPSEGPVSFPWPEASEDVPADVAFFLRFTQ